MKNERNAGRKSKIDGSELEEIRIRISAGEKVSGLALEYGISRQALYKKLKEDDTTLVLDYVVNDELCTRMELDTRREIVDVINYASRISARAFGLIEYPKWEELRDFLERQYLLSINAIKEDGSTCFVCNDVREDNLDLGEVVGSSLGRLVLRVSEGAGALPAFTFSKKDILYSRTDTDGYQLKALSGDRRLFVKSQAIISGICMDDWKVEVLATNICNQLHIPCVQQRPCDFVYGARRFKGVYSANFELDGYTFVSFECILERMGRSSREDAFIHMSSIEKMKWCATMLSEAGDISYEQTIKYMLDLALVDCLVGNVDRHTRNFGLFFNMNTGQYEIPLVFDNGMGLFEHDSYRDKYDSFDAAMMSVYVAPYGEDPFEMVELLNKEFDLLSIYPELSDIKVNTCNLSGFATEYIERMLAIWQR